MGEMTYDLVAHIREQREFSERTFGPGSRAQGVVDHIRKELVEIEQNPTDIVEWIDVVLLALDGAWRTGYSPEVIAAVLAGKLRLNKARTWPDWRTAEPGKAIEHVRTEDPLNPELGPEHREYWIRKAERRRTNPVHAESEDATHEES